MEEFEENKCTAIGHTKQLFDNSVQFNCTKCHCLHLVEISPIEVHVFKQITEQGITVTQESLFLPI